LTRPPLHFLVACGYCADRGRDRGRVFGELHRMTDEKGGGWGYRPQVKPRGSSRGGRRVKMVSEFQTSGTVKDLACWSCKHKPTPTVRRLGDLAVEAETRGKTIVYI
jgi:hypothetical protein